MIEIPDEVLIAKKAYYGAYELIRAKVREQKRKYIGTDLEDCPPLIKEQGQFFVRKKDYLPVKERLTKTYGEVPLNWVLWVAWYEGKR